MADYLPEYVAEALEGGAPELRYPRVAEHLAGCAACRDDLAELMALARATYADRDEQPGAYPTPELGRLAAAPPAQPGPARLWWNDGLGRWLIGLSAELLASGRPSPLVGLARADDLLYDLRVPREAEDAPELQVTVLGERGGTSVLVRVSVDLADYDALDMAGVEVTLAAGEAAWRAISDAAGTASLSGIPRQALEGATLCVRAGRST